MVTFSWQFEWRIYVCRNILEKDVKSYRGTQGIEYIWYSTAITFHSCGSTWILLNRTTLIILLLPIYFILENKCRQLQLCII